MLEKPPTENAVTTNSAPSSASERLVVARTCMPTSRCVRTCCATASIGGSDDSSTSINTTCASCSDSWLAKSTSSLGVQCVLPPPTMVMCGVAMRGPMTPSLPPTACDGLRRPPTAHRMTRSAPRPTVPSWRGGRPRGAGERGIGRERRRGKPPRSRRAAPATPSPALRPRRRDRARDRRRGWGRRRRPHEGRHPDRVAHPTGLDHDDRAARDHRAAGHDDDHPALRGLGRPGVGVHALLPLQGRGLVDVSRRPDAQLLRAGPGAGRAACGVEVPGQGHVLAVRGPGRDDHLVRQRLDGGAGRLRAGRPHVGRVQRLRPRRALRRRGDRPGHHPAVPHRRHHQGVRDGRSRRLPARLLRVARQLLPRRRHRPAASRPSCTSCPRRRCRRRCGTTTGTAAGWCSTTTCSRAARTARSTS